MGLEEKQKMNHFETGALANRQGYLQSETGAAITVTVAWDSFGGEATSTQVDRLDMATSELTNAIVGLCGDAMAKEAFVAAVSSLVVSHDGSITNPEDFKVVINDKTLSFAANFDQFVSNNTSEHESIGAAIKKLL